MSLQHTGKKYLQKKGEDDSMAWRTYAVEKLVDLGSVIQDMVQQKDKLPDQLLEVANTILKTSLGLDSLKNHKKDFEQLLGEASTLLVTLRKLYFEANVMYQSLAWPPPKLRDLVKKLVDTTCCIHKLMERKSEKNLAKRVLLGCFGIRDLGKFIKYQQKLGSMALILQSKPHNIKIHAVLLAVVPSRAQPQDEDSDSEFAGEQVEGDFPDKTSAKKKAADRKSTAEGSRLHIEGKPTTVKPAKQRAKSEEDSQRKCKKIKNEAKYNRKHVRDEERSAEGKSARKIDRRPNCDQDAQGNQYTSKTMRYEPDEVDLAEPTSPQGSRSNKAAQWKTRKKPSQAHEDEENIRDRAPKQKNRSRTIPVSPETLAPPPRHTISDFSFINGSGVMINENIGNSYNITRG